MKKKLLPIACLLTIACTCAQAEINQKTLTAFHSVFTSAKNVKWTETKDCYLVSFYQNDMLVKAVYDKNGTLLNSLRYYGAQRLPIHVLYKVRETYPSKSIMQVTELSNQDGTVYFIELKDKNGWTMIKSDASAELEVTDKFADAGH